MDVENRVILKNLRSLQKNIKISALCGLGQTAPNPVLSTIRYFRDEYEAHINEKRCPSGTCKNLLSMNISAEKCKGCGLCKTVCHVNAIDGEKRSTHVVNHKKCIKCKACIEKCPFSAISLK